MNNEQAFPSAVSLGMTLRDYLAAQALIGIVSVEEHTYYHSDYHAKMAATAYKIADAMMKAREQQD